MSTLPPPTPAGAGWTALPPPPPVPSALAEPPASLAEPPVPRPRRGRAAGLAVGAVVLVALVVGGSVWLARRRAEPDVARVRTELGGLVALPPGLRSTPRSSWTFPAGQSTIRWAVAAEGDVFVVSETEGRLVVSRLDGEHGALTWASELPAGEVRSASVGDDLVVVAVQRDGGPTVEALDAASGEPLWTDQREGEDAVVAVPEQGGLVVGVASAGDGAELFVLGDDGDERWSEPVEQVQVDGDDVLVVNGGSIGLLDLPTGAEWWRRPRPGGAEAGLVGGRVVVAERQQVSAFDRDGVEVWRQALPADDPVRLLGQGDDLVVVLRQSGVAALDAADGTRRWEGPAAGVFTDTDPTTLTIRSTDDDVTLRVVDGSTGREQGTRVLSPPSGLALAADVVYVGDGRGVTAYDRPSLERLWSTVVTDAGDVQVIQSIDGGVLVRNGQGDLVVLR